MFSGRAVSNKAKFRIYAALIALCASYLSTIKSYPQVIHRDLKNWLLSIFSHTPRRVTMKWGKVGNFGESIGFGGRIGEVCWKVEGFPLLFVGVFNRKNVERIEKVLRLPCS
jgi:hypothetical protein